MFSEDLPVAARVSAKPSTTDRGSYESHLTGIGTAIRCQESAVCTALCSFITMRTNNGHVYQCLVIMTYLVTDNDLLMTKLTQVNQKNNPTHLLEHICRMTDNFSGASRMCCVYGTFTSTVS